MSKNFHRVCNVVEGVKHTNDWVLPPLTVGAVPEQKLSSETDGEVFSRALSGGPVLDQGATSACVGFSGADVLSDTPGGRWKTFNPFWIYEKAKLYDRWAGEDYDGTSISGACEALRKDGAILGQHDPVADLYTPVPEEDRFRIHAYYKLDLNRVEEMKSLLQQERLWIAVNMYEPMIRPDTFIEDVEGHLGNFYGGHAMTITGYRQKNGKLYWQLKNSWGIWWGNRGYAWIDHSLLKKVILRTGLYYLVTTQERAEELKAIYDALSWWEKLKIKVKKWWKKIF